MAARPVSRFDRVVQTCTIVLFLGLISLPALGLIFQRQTPGFNEKRALAPAPTLSQAWYSPTRFITGLRAYLDDHFGFRSTLIRWNGKFTARALSVSISPSVIIGRDGWLYYAEDHILEDYRCLQPFTEAELAQWAGLLERRQAWLQQRGCRYLFFVAPNEHTIYPEHLPATLTRVRDTSRLDQLLAYLRAHTTVTVVDLRPALLAAKAQERVYQKTDTHWNERGAFIAYQELFKPIHVWFPRVRALPRQAFADTDGMGPGGDLADLMGTPDLYREEVLGLRPLEPRRARMSLWPASRLGEFVDRPSSVQEAAVADPGLPRMVLLHDSFGVALVPFLAEHFSRSVFIPTTMGFDAPVLEREQPDLVLQEITERHLWIDYPDKYQDRP
jgi:hypothetical protein